MVRKLLNITLRKYILFSIVLMLVSVPLFYLVISQMYLDDTDEAMYMHKMEFEKSFAQQFSPEEILIWNKLNRDVKVFPSKQTIEDSWVSTTYFDSLDTEWEPYREMKSMIDIQGERYVYIERKNLIESDDIIINIALLFTLILVLLFAGFILITKRLTSKLWIPFYSTLEKIEGFEIDKNAECNLAQSNIEEFNRLNESIDKLIERNRKIFKIQREFVENAAHELQTPLAVFQGKIDNLIQKEGITDEQYQSLDSLGHSVGDLRRLNKNLLLLTSLDNSGFDMKENVNLSQVYQDKCEFYQDQALAQKISIHTDLTSDIVFYSNPMLVDILVSNLIMNAIKHNREAGEIWIELKENQLIVKNSGSETALNETKIFNRFEKTAGSNSGNGLGLAIVKRIVELNGWTITYSFENNLHVFRVKI